MGYPECCGAQLPLILWMSGPNNTRLCWLAKNSGPLVAKGAVGPHSQTAVNFPLCRSVRLKLGVGMEGAIPAAPWRPPVQLVGLACNTSFLEIAELSLEPAALSLLWTLHTPPQ